VLLAGQLGGLGERVDLGAIQTENAPILSGKRKFVMSRASPSGSYAPARAHRLSRSTAPSGQAVRWAIRGMVTQLWGSEVPSRSRPAPPAQHPSRADLSRPGRTREWPL
jgi:hypothetical protein